MAKELTQIATGFVLDGKDANEKLRTFQKDYPQRKIIGVSITPNEPMGWFMTITYNILI